MAASTMSAQPQNSVFPKSHVGFDSITSQIEKKLLKRGFQFNVICVGQSHTLRTTHCASSHPSYTTIHY
jgi:septin 3/9/12